jgi:hypothetical protein
MEDLMRHKRRRNSNEIEKRSQPNWVMARRQKGNEDFPIENYFDYSSGELTPAVVEEKVISRGLPENVISFNLLAKGQHPFIVLAERRNLDPEVEEAFMDLMANLNVASCWERLFIRIRIRSADLYVIDRNNNRYLVKDVILDWGSSSSGVLKLQPLGKKGRKQTRMDMDVAEAYGFMLPVIVYKPYRS